MNANIKEICGESEITPDFEAIASNPTFVFEPDETFETLILYNSDGSVLHVNSWLECANYVNGGWTNGIFPTVNYESYFFYFLIFSSLACSVISIIYKKYAN